jgi:hypothetical protein
MMRWANSLAPGWALFHVGNDYRSSSTGGSEQVLGQVLTENAAIGDRPTVIDGNELNGTCRVVTKHICGLRVTGKQFSDRSFSHLGAYPGEMVGVMVDVDDEPAAARAVMRATDVRPVPTGENVVDDEFEVKSAEPQHAYSALFSCWPAEPSFSLPIPLGTRRGKAEDSHRLVYDPAQAVADGDLYFGAHSFGHRPGRCDMDELGRQQVRGSIVLVSLELQHERFCPPSVQMPSRRWTQRP